MYKELRASILLPRMIMKIGAVNADGTVTATTSGGMVQRVIGTGNVGDNIYVQDRRVLGTAPDLPFVEIEV